jgi:uncharacterized protein (TIGR02271 family)
MADRNPAIHEKMAPLSELSDYEVADDSRDIRGWTITGSTGADIGKVKDLIVDANTMQARYLVVSLKGDVDRGKAGDGSPDPVLVPVARAHIDENDKRVHLDSSGAGLAALPRYRGDAIDRDYNETFKRHEKQDARESASSGRTPSSSGEQRITRSAEELRIGKRKVAAGEAHVRKHVETERVSEPVTRTREEVYVERRPVSGGDGSRRPEIRDDEVRVPVMEEEITVEKRPVVKEELVVGKRQVTETDQVEADLRKEKVDVEQHGREHYGTPPNTKKER